MSTAAKRAKTETLSLRLDPKTKFMLDFVARVQGQSITTVVERSVQKVAAEIKVIPDDFDERTWSSFWDASEGVRTLNLIAVPNYPTNFEEDELLTFTKTHWPFFYTSEKAITPRRSYIGILWPKVSSEYLDTWRDQRRANYWAAGEAMRLDLEAAQVAAPEWPTNSKANGPRVSFTADLDDEIPF